MELKQAEKEFLRRLGFTEQDGVMRRRDPIYGEVLFSYFRVLDFTSPGFLLARNSLYYFYSAPGGTEDAYERLLADIPRVLGGLKTPDREDIRLFLDRGFQRDGCHYTDGRYSFFYDRGWRGAIIGEEGPEWRHQRRFSSAEEYFIYADARSHYALRAEELDTILKRSGLWLRHFTSCQYSQATVDFGYGLGRLQLKVDLDSMEARVDSGERLLLDEEGLSRLKWLYAHRADLLKGSR